MTPLDAFLWALATLTALVALYVALRLFGELLSWVGVILAGILVAFGFGLAWLWGWLKRDDTPTRPRRPLSTREAEKLIRYLTAKMGRGDLDHLDAPERLAGIVGTVVADTLLVADGSLRVEDFRPQGPQ